MSDEEQAKRHWAKIVILYGHIDKLESRFPEPRSENIQNILTMFERKALSELRKLKDLNN